MKDVFFSVAYVMPCMRPMEALCVLEDLNNQTLKPNYVLLVDNGGDFMPVKEYDFDFEIHRPGENIGTNAVWNMCLKLDADYVGIVADDLRLSDCLIDKSIKVLNEKHGKKNRVTAGCVTANVVKALPLPEYDPDNLEVINCATGKGKAGTVLMKKEIAQKIPPIPCDLFKIFFGDNWLSFHLKKKIGVAWLLLRDCYIYHKPGQNQVSRKLRYKFVLERERRLWINYWKQHDENVKRVY